MDEIKMRAINGVPPRAIRCPECNNRHYTVRTETKRYFEEGMVTVLCGCGCWYQILNRGENCIIRRKI